MYCCTWVLTNEGIGGPTLRKVTLGTEEGKLTGLSEGPGPTWEAENGGLVESDMIVRCMFGASMAEYKSRLNVGGEATKTSPRKGGSLEGRRAFRQLIGECQLT